MKKGMEGFRHALYSKKLLYGGRDSFREEGKGLRMEGLKGAISIHGRQNMDMGGMQLLKDFPFIN